MMTRQKVVAVGCALCLTASLGARQTAGSKAAAASIQGRVLTADSQPQPLRRVRVTLKNLSSAGGEQAVLTDEAGQFAFAALPPGRFELRAAKPAFLPAGVSALQPAGRETSLVLDAGQQLSGVVLRMIRGGVLTGVVRDASGNPLSGVPVTARSVDATGGIRRLMPLTSVETSVTDDLGAYRLYGLPPGEFVVAAAPAVFVEGGTELVESAGPVRESQRSSRVPYSRSYHPGTSAGAAVAVRVAPGAEVSGIDVTVPFVPTARVQGRIENSLGVTLSGIDVWLEPADAVDFGETVWTSTFNRVTRQGEAFDVLNVATGRYLLRALATPPGSSHEFGPVRYWAEEELTIDGADRLGLVLSLRPGIELTGRVEFRAAAGPSTAPAESSPSPAGIQLRLTNADSDRSRFAPPATTTADGTFSFGGIIGGRYRVRVPQRPGWILESITGVGDLDLTDAPLVVDGSTTSLRLVVTFVDRQAELTGVLYDAAGAEAHRNMVVVASTDAAMRSPRSRRVQITRPGADAYFRFANLPGGNYFVAVIAETDGVQLYDDGFLAALEQAGLKVTLRTGQTTRQDIRMVR